MIEEFRKSRGTVGIEDIAKKVISRTEPIMTGPM